MSPQECIDRFGLEPLENHTLLSASLGMAGGAFAPAAVVQSVHHPHHHRRAG
jgi:hypothetical protein